MMDRRHLKDTFSVSRLKIRNLDHNRQHFYKIDQSDQQNKQRHLHHVSSTCNKSAQSQRSCITHKNSCRIYIEQKESHQSSDYRSCHRLDTTSHTNGNNSKENCNDQRYAGCQTVKSVCKVYTVYGTDHSKEKNRYRQPAEIQIMIRPERDTHRKIHICIVQYIIYKDSGYNNLKTEFLPCQKTIRTSQYYLEIIIQKTDDTKSQCQKQYRNHVRIILCIKQGRHYGCNQEDHTSHGRSTRLLQM